jgi:hypothetical protein
MANLDLNGGQLTRQGGLTTLLSSQTPISHIRSTNLIFEFCESCPTHSSEKMLSSVQSWYGIANCRSTMCCLSASPGFMNSTRSVPWKQYPSVPLVSSRTLFVTVLGVVPLSGKWGYACTRYDMILKRCLLARCSRSQPKEEFQEAYNKGALDLIRLEVTDETLGPRTAMKLPSFRKLSDVRAEQTLIVTFCMDVSIELSRRPLTTTT